VVQSCTGKDPTHVRFGSKARKQTSELGRAFWLVILSALFDRASAGARLRKFSGRSCLPPTKKRSRAPSPERPRKIFIGFLRPSSAVLRYCLFRSQKMKVRTSLIGLLVVRGGSP
jgi:hypothetical protein